MALKSTYKFHELGRSAEAHVKNFFISRGWTVRSERLKYDGVEVDLVIEKENRLVLLEVKSLDNIWRSFERIESKQIQRLRYVLLGLRQREKKYKTEGYVAFVFREGTLKFISIDEIII